MHSHTPHLKRLWLISCLLAALLLLALLIGTWLRSPFYRSHARLRIEPFTNGVLKAAFLEQTFGTLTGLRVEKDESCSMLSIAADAPTADAARRLADDATQVFRIAARQTYGVSIEIIDNAVVPLRPYSLLRDELWPRVERFLKRVGLPI